jgi:GTPase
MTSEQEILEILQIGETQNAEFKQRLTKADLKQDRRQKLVTRIRYMTCWDRGRQWEEMDGKWAD